MFNIWSIIISMVLSVVLGFIWYGPLFGKAWMELSGIAKPEGKPKFSMMVKPIILSLIGAILISGALSSFTVLHNAYYHVSGALTTMALGVFIWLGFFVPVYLNFLGWEGKSKKLFFIHIGYWLVFLLISGAVVGMLV